MPTTHSTSHLELVYSQHIEVDAKARGEGHHLPTPTITPQGVSQLYDKLDTKRLSTYYQLTETSASSTIIVFIDCYSSYITLLYRIYNWKGAHSEPTSYVLSTGKASTSSTS